MNSARTTDHSTPRSARAPAAVRYGTPALRDVIAAIGERTNASIRGGEYPHAAIDLVRQSGLGALRVPTALGGGGCTLRELFATIMDLAAVAPDIPHILRSHFWFVEDRLRSAESAERTMWLERIVRGDIFGNAVTEIGGSAAVGTWIMKTTLTPSGDGHVLNGRKYYVTGSLYCDWVRVHASNPDGGTVICIVPTDREGVILDDDWDGIGQRFTGSGTGIFENVAVSELEVLHAASAFASSDEPGDVDEDAVAADAYIVGQQVQLILTAIIAGIMRNTATDAVAHIRGRGRTYSHASAETAPADPLLQDIVGRIASLAMAAESIILAAGDALDAADATLASGDTDLDVVHHGSIAAAQAKVVIDELAPRAATMLFDIGGSSAIRQSANLDRHWRNARTLASHNPTPYKARAVGDFLINGTRLPINGFF